MPLNCCTYILLFFILCLRVPPSHFHCYEVSNFWSRLLHWFFTLFLFLQLAQLGLVCAFEFFFFVVFISKILVSFIFLISGVVFAMFSGKSNPSVFKVSFLSMGLIFRTRVFL